jgi:hypothetical protein
MQKMENHQARTDCLPVSRISPVSKANIFGIAVLLLVAALLPSACFLRGGKRAIMPTAPIRVAFLPFNVPEEDEDLHWTSMAVPVMLTMISRESDVLEPVPMYETMRFTLESVRNSRQVLPENAAYVANWLNAKWSVIGKTATENKEQISLLMDFIPPQDTRVPFRYLKKIRMEDFDTNVRKSFDEFLYYLSAPLPGKGGRKRISLISLRQLSAALDREYGWTVAPEPGKSEEIVSNLAQSDMWLAQQLFNPTLYSILKDKE